MAKVRSKTHFEGDTLVGDETLGCACAHTLLQLPQNQGKKTPKRTASQDGLFNVDLYETSLGAKYDRFFCHKRLTNRSPGSITEPGRYEPQRKAGLIRRAFQTMGHTIRGFFRLMLPRIQFGVGINLFRLNGN